MKTHSRSIRATALALAVIGAVAAGQASASGFQLREQSVKNLGKSNAGSIVGKDASNVSLNPAAMTNLDKTTIQSDITVIDLTASFTGSGKVLSPLSPINLTGGNGGDPGSPTVVPNMAVVFPMSGALEGMTLGASIGAPFGLKTDYDPGWVGRYRALTSDLKTVDLTLSAAFKASDGVSIGFGLVYERAEATLSKAVDFGTAICAAAAPGGAACFNPLFPIKPQAHDGAFEVSGDSTGIGYIVGAQIAPNDKLAIGFSHRSEIKHDLEGTLDFTVPGTVVPALTAAGRIAAFADGDGGARLVTPTITTLSISYGFTDQFRVLADYQSTGWSSLKDVTIKRANGTVVGSEDFSWEDTDFVSIGAEYDINDAFTLRAGVGQDESPTNDAARTPRLPDNDRKLYSIGASWNVSENLSVDAAFQRINIDNPTINLPTTYQTGGSDTSTLIGEFEGHANLYGVSMQYRF